ncbi:uncharacterized protein RCC_09038 [Ramularia collo-cygni]|uniref:Uncharacterized protein n=1 Tax=Ramularia collo-cygni TaxID=112498 RepID=A0A2D3V1Q0_9PEZI|nr:uncharacterized protein RCC_09038 [Ramularia collo-cygni]CZT23326.1 uncharacterized protein RCC_09038 [Ramularia collo-cygni]
MRITNTIYCFLGSALLSNAQTVDLGTASSFDALGAAGVTNTGLTVITGSVGTTGDSVTGFPPGVFSGSLEVGTAAAATADADFQSAYDQGSALEATVDYAGLAEIGGLTLAPGVYNFDTAVTLTGILTLSGSGTYVFQFASSFTTASGSSVLLTNGASACDVFVLAGTSVTLGTESDFSGNILAQAAVTLTTGASVDGGLYAGTAVTLDTNIVNACDAQPPVSSTSSSTTMSSTSSTSSSISTSSPVITTSSSSSLTTSTSSTTKATTTSSSSSLTTSTSSTTKATTTKKTTTEKSTTKATTTKKPTTTSSTWKTSTTKKPSPSEYPTATTTKKPSPTEYTTATTTKKTTATTKKATTTTKKETTTTKKETTTTKKQTTTTKKSTTTKPAPPPMPTPPKPTPPKPTPTKKPEGPKCPDKKIDLVGYLACILNGGHE